MHIPSVLHRRGPVQNTSTFFKTYFQRKIYKYVKKNTRKTGKLRHLQKEIMSRWEVITNQSVTLSSSSKLSRDCFPLLKWFRLVLECTRYSSDLSSPIASQLLLSLYYQVLSFTRCMKTDHVLTFKNCSTVSSQTK